MEVNIFPSPAVAGVLSKNFVEARLHVDAPDGEARERVLAWQNELQGAPGTPYYILIDPVNDAHLAVLEQATFSEDAFRDFLLSGVERRENVARR